MRSRCPLGQHGVGQAFGARLLCSYVACRERLKNEDHDLRTGAAHRGNTLGPLLFSTDAMISLSDAMSWVSNYS